MEKHLLTRKETAKYLNLALATIDLLVARRELPRVKIGRKVLFKKEDLDKFIDQHYQGNN